MCGEGGPRFTSVPGKCEFCTTLSAQRDIIRAYSVRAYIAPPSHRSISISTGPAHSSRVWGCDQSSVPGNHRYVRMWPSQLTCAQSIRLFSIAYVVPLPTFAIVSTISGNEDVADGGSPVRERQVVLVI